MGMHAFRRLREQEALAADAANKMEPPSGHIEPGTFNQHPPKRRGRKPKAEADTTTGEN